MLTRKCRILILNIFFHITQSCAHPLPSCCFFALVIIPPKITSQTDMGHWDSSRFQFCLARRKPSWWRQHFFWFSLFSSLLWPGLSIRLRLHFLFSYMISSFFFSPSCSSRSSPLDYDFSTPWVLIWYWAGSGPWSILKLNLFFLIGDPGWSWQDPWSISILLLSHSFLSARKKYLSSLQEKTSPFRIEIVLISSLGECRYMENQEIFLGYTMRKSSSGNPFVDSKRMIWWMVCCEA